MIGILGLLAQMPATAEPTVPAVSANDLAALISEPQSEAANAAAARLLRAAEAGNSFAMYDIGSLARQTERSGASSIAYDPGMALKWLTRAFDHGRLMASYKLALTYRDIGDTLEAMAWAQVYAHYQDEISRTESRTPSNVDAAPKQRSDGMVASLMAGLYAELGADKSESIRLRTIALLQEHGPRFEPAYKRGVDPAHLGDIPRIEGCVPPKRMPRGIWQHGRIKDSAPVEALIQIDAEGRPLQVHLFDFSRKALNAASTMKLVMTYRCPAAASSRWTFVNMALDDRRYNVVAE
jgi:hypothetical protein